MSSWCKYSRCYSPTCCITERDRNYWVAEMSVARVATPHAISPVQNQDIVVAYLLFAL